MESKTFGVMQSCICNHTSHVALYTEVLLRKKSKKGALGITFTNMGGGGGDLCYGPKKRMTLFKERVEI